MTIRPLHDRLLAQRAEERETLAGGIVIPDTAKEKPQRGRVAAVGTGRRTNDGRVIPLDVHVGDEILFGKYSGTDVVLGGEDYLMLREDEVLGILDESVEGRKAA
jgi:chaperonin GroES